MEAVAAVPWWKRLLLAFLATVLVHVLSTAWFTVRGLSSLGALHEPFFRQGGGGQLAGWFLIVGGYFVLVAFLSVGAPLALFVSMRFQLRHWYGMLLAAALLPLLLFATIGARDVSTFWHHVYERSGGYVALCGLVTGSLYLWMLKRSAHPRALVR